MRLATVETESRRYERNRRMAWDLGERVERDASRAHLPRGHIAAWHEARLKLGQLEEQIGAQHDRIASLMHERNAHPEDSDVKARLQQAFDRLDALQEDRAERMSAYFHPRFPLPTEAELRLLREAEAIVEEYENNSTDDPAPGDSVRPKPSS